MRILMISPTMPWPLKGGARIRIYHEIKEVARAGHKITLLSLNMESHSRQDLDALKPYCRELQVVPVKHRPRWQAAVRAFFSLKPYRVAKFESLEFRKQVAKALSKSYEVVWVHFLETLAYFPNDWVKGKHSLIVLDQHNADEIMWQRYTNRGPLPVRVFARQNLWKLRRFQEKALKNVDIVLSVSDAEADFMRNRVSLSCQVWTVPNGVDIDYFRPSETKHRYVKKPIILFCGSMDVTMNIDAVTRFSKAIFSIIKEKIPQAEFWIVGRQPTLKVRDLGRRDGVTVFGEVEDVRSYYEQASVAVAPFLYGAGTKLKVLEAMAMGIPVVATSVGCQGIEAEPGHHLYLAETENVFAERVVKLIQDPNAHAQLATAGQKLVEERYSWRRIVGEVAQRLEEVVNHHAR